MLVEYNQRGKMDIVYHPKYIEVYTSDPAAEEGRIEAIIDVLKTKSQYIFHEPQPAIKDQILRAHSPTHFEDIASQQNVFEMAMLAAGGAILTANIAAKGRPAFAVIRPPGHHASADSCWGFCFFNNMAVALLDIFQKYHFSSAFLLDFDLHRGDGNINILGSNQAIHILNPSGRTEEEYLANVAQEMQSIEQCDIICASAGFDHYKLDWGGLLSTDAYTQMGKMMKEFAEAKCNGRRFGILEGGYYHPDLGKNVDAFCRGLD